MGGNFRGDQKDSSIGLGISHTSLALKAALSVHGHYKFEQYKYLNEVRKIQFSGDLAP
jgi:hypothetical protein